MILKPTSDRGKLTSPRVQAALFRLCVSEYNVLFILKVVLVIHAADSSCWPSSSSKIAFC
jgi:hypothetical protein